MLVCPTFSKNYDAGCFCFFLAPIPRMSAAAPAPSFAGTASGLPAGFALAERTAASIRQSRSKSNGVTATPANRAKASICISEIGFACIPNWRRLSRTTNQSQMCWTSCGRCGRSPFHPLEVAASAKAISSSARPSRNLLDLQWLGRSARRPSEAA